MHRLKGPKDSKVKIGVKRYGEKGVKDVHGNYVVILL